MDEIKKEFPYAEDTVRKLIAMGAIRGSGKVDANGDPADMDLSRDMLRMMVFNDRAALTAIKAMGPAELAGPDF